MAKEALPETIRIVVVAGLSDRTFKPVVQGAT